MHFCLCQKQGCPLILKPVTPSPKTYQPREKRQREREFVDSLLSWVSQYEKQVMKMLIQRSFPDSLNTELSFVSDLAKQHNMELLCDWSHCGEVWQKATNDKCPFNTCRKSICTGEEGSKISSSEIMEISKTSSDISAVKDMCANFASKWDGFVYKRRRLRRNTVTLLSEENAVDCGKGINGSNMSIISTGNPLIMQKSALQRAPLFTVGGSSGKSLDSGNSSISGQHHLQKSITIPCSQIKGAKNSASLLEPTQNDRLLVREVTLPTETFVSNHLKSMSGHCFHVHTSSPSSKSNSRQDSATMKAHVDCGECSMSDVIATESLEEFTSARDLCISVLKRHGLLVGVNTSSACAPLRILGVNDANISQSCKICNLLEDPLKMLICDLCEDVFHVSCCHPKVKKLPADHWYCQPCFKKKPKPLLGMSSKKSANILSKHRYRKSNGRGGPILSMLRDNQPYRSEVRIGKDFQAEIPQWTGATSEDSNYFNEHLEVDLADCVSFDVQNAENPSKFSSIRNWIQCREVTYKNKKDKGTICGKWRRAPLFSVQTADWDCSCSVLWDPIHADCAVPQELETDVILEQLKYVEMLRPRLTINKQRPQESRADGPE